MCVVDRSYAAKAERAKRDQSCPLLPSPTWTPHGENQYGDDDVVIVVRWWCLGICNMDGVAWEHSHEQIIDLILIITAFSCVIVPRPKMIPFSKSSILSTERRRPLRWEWHSKRRVALVTMRARLQRDATMTYHYNSMELYMLTDAVVFKFSCFPQIEILPFHKQPVSMFGYTSIYVCMSLCAHA